MKYRKPLIIFELANSHNGNYELLDKSIIDFFKINYANKAIKLQIFKYDLISEKNLNYFKIYKKLFFSEKKWNYIIHKLYKKKTKIYLDIYDDYGIKILKKNINKIHGIKIQYDQLFKKNIYEELKKIVNYNLNIILNVSSYSLEDIKNSL